MGMDVYGINPTSSDGDYFRNNVWWWRPLWDYCCHVDTELATKVPYGHSNDGDGLQTDEECQILANQLQESIDNGSAESYIAEYYKEIEALPLETCRICGGTGKKTDETTCFSCEGKGEVKSWAASYPIDIENIQNFANFLRKCGGFKIC